MNKFQENKDMPKQQKNPLQAGLTSAITTVNPVLAKKKSPEETFVGEETMEAVDTVRGKICFVEAPALDRKKLQGLTVSERMWRRVFNVMFWYGNPEKGDFLIPESFSAVYGCLYGESFGPQLFGLDNLQRIFQHFQEWIRIDLDPAGFMRLQLRQAPATSVRGIATMSATYGKKSLEMKHHPLTFYLEDSEEEEEEELMRDSLHEKFSVSHPGSVSLPKAMEEHDLRFRMYYLILRHFPTGMDVRELVKSWHEKYGNPFNAQATYNSSLEHIVQVYMKDLLHIEKKSPAHNIISARLDVPIEIPKRLLKKVGLMDAYRTIRKVENIPPSSVRPKTKMAAAFSPDCSSRSSSFTADEARSEITGGQLVMMPEEIGNRLRMFLGENPGGMTLMRLHMLMLESGMRTWHLLTAGQSEDRLKMLLEETGILDVKFTGRNWWLKMKDDSWCSLYWSEMENSLDGGLQRSVTSPDPNGTQDDSAFWSPSESSRILTSTPVRSSSGASTSGKSLFLKKTNVSEQDTGQFWLKKAMQMAELGAASSRGITVPQILRNLEDQGVELEKKEKAELHEWIVTCQKFSFQYDERDTMRLRAK